MKPLFGLAYVVPLLGLTLPAPRLPAQGATTAIAHRFTTAGPFSNGLARVKIASWVDGVQEGNNGPYGFVDKQGKVVIEPKYMGASDFANGLAMVKVADTGSNRFGYIDTHGKLAIAPQFGWAQGFSEGLAFVVYNDGRGVFIDTNGVVVLDLKKLHPRLFQVEGFKDGLAAVRLISATPTIHEYVDLQLKTVGAPRSAADSAKTRTVYSDDSFSWGFVDIQGRMVITPTCR